LFFVTTQYICFVQTNRIHITGFLKGAKNHLLLDVRSPAEYAHAHIPGAVSFPLFTDEERKIVGTAYKQESREKAIKIGLDIFGPKMRGMVEEAEKLSGSCRLANGNKEASSPLPAASSIYIYCWRGGMRSGAVSWLLGLYGFKIYTLAGGYKAFRNHVLKAFEQPFDLKILGGYTGSGKTAILNELEKKGEAVIDLEKIACHKGSAFGNIKMPAQPTQEMFENVLAGELWEKAKGNEQWTKQNSESEHAPFTNHPSLWLEDESQRIGNLNIPMAFWQTMRTAPLYFLEIPFDERLNYIVEEYGHCDVQKLMDATQRISKRLGGLETKNVLAWLEQGEIKEAFRILLHYYDKRYLKGLHNRENISALLSKIPCKNVTPFNAKALLNQYQNL
jgi:tRNA 2-selenouridine synthase